MVLSLFDGRGLPEIVVDEGIAAVAILVVAFSVVEVLVASHRPENPVGWIFCSAAFFQGLSVCGYEHATYALVTKPGSLPLGAEATFIRAVADGMHSPPERGILRRRKGFQGREGTRPWPRRETR